MSLKKQTVSNTSVNYENLLRAISHFPENIEQSGFKSFNETHQVEGWFNMRPTVWYKKSSEDRFLNMLPPNVNYWLSELKQVLIPFYIPLTNKRRPWNQS